MEIKNDSRWSLVRSFGLRGLGLAAAFSTGAFLGLTQTSVETTMGPHQAEAHMTFDDATTVDAGPLGSIITPVDLPFGLGVEIELKEIPVAAPDRSSEFTAEDVETYARFLAEPDQDIEDTKERLIDRAVAGGMAGMVGAAALFLLVGKRRRQELTSISSDVLASRKTRAVMASVVFLSTTFAYDVSNAQDRAIDVNPVFAGTPLEDAQVTGKLLHVVLNTYAPEVVEYFNRDREFYDEVIDNLQATYTIDDAAAQNGYTPVLFYSDLHCNLGMARVIGHIQSLYRPQVVLDGGDVTISGTDLERQCVSTIDKYVDGTVILAPGNHDSTATQHQATGHNFQVLEGDVVTAGGFRILGDDDPMRSVFGQDTRQRGGETLEQMSKRLASAACRQTVDILLVHNPRAAEAAVEQGCVPLVLSGHTHHERLRQVGVNTLFTAGSAGGSENFQPTLGSLRNEAYVYVLYFNALGQAVSYTTIEVSPEATVRVSHTPMPA